MIWAAWAVASIALAGVGIAPDVFLVAICAAITYFGLTHEPPVGHPHAAGALASSIGVRETVLVGAGLSALSCLVIFVPGVRDPERPDYAPVPLPGDDAGPLGETTRVTAQSSAAE